jgi:hypothetical protein
MFPVQILNSWRDFIMMYTLTFINNSINPGAVCLYQKPVDMKQFDVESLAWLTYSCNPNVEVDLSWSADYNFVWSKTGILKPGVKFKAAETVAADLNEKNSIVLDQNDFGYLFAQTSCRDATTTPNGSLRIFESANISMNDVAVGIAMSGSGVFVKQGQPNLSLSFTPHPNYWITFGDFEQGEVLDIEVLTNSQEITFEPGIYTMYAILNIDNTWTITSERP